MLRPLAPQDVYAMQQSVVYNAITRVLSERRVYASDAVRAEMAREVLRGLSDLSNRVREGK
jgi:hypothetical protein